MHNTVVIDKHCGIYHHSILHHCITSVDRKLWQRRFNRYCQHHSILMKKPFQWHFWLSFCTFMPQKQVFQKSLTYTKFFTNLSLITHALSLASTLWDCLLKPLMQHDSFLCLKKHPMIMQPYEWGRCWRACINLGQIGNLSRAELESWEHSHYWAFGLLYKSCALRTVTWGNQWLEDLG